LLGGFQRVAMRFRFVPYLGASHHKLFQNQH
jgi:hypothetical protein